MAKRGRDDAMLSSTYPVDGSASEVITQMPTLKLSPVTVDLLVFHLFVEQLIVKLLHL